MSLQQAWASVANFTPRFIGAIIIFLVGWIIAAAVGKVVEQIIKALKIDELLAKLDFEKSLARAGVKLDAGAFFGGLVKWFLVIVFLLAAVNILGLTQVSDFLKDVLLYIPNVVVAALILVIAGLLAEIVEKLVRASVESLGYRGSFVGLMARWSIWIFALIAALLQLGIAAMLIQTLLTGLVAAIAIAAGLAFGLGGKDAAAAFLDKFRSEIKK